MGNPWRIVIAFRFSAVWIPLQFGVERVSACDKGVKDCCRGTRCVGTVCS